MSNLNVRLWAEDRRMSNCWVCIECSVIFKRFALLGRLRYSLLMQCTGMSKPLILCHFLAKRDLGVWWLALSESRRLLEGGRAEKICAP